MQTASKRKLCIAAIVAVAALAFIYAISFTSASKSGQATYVRIDHDDTEDSVYTKLSSVCTGTAMWGIRLTGALTAYSSHVHTGFYIIDKSTGALKLMRKLRGGHQDAMSLTIPVVHTTDDLAGKLAAYIESDSTGIARTMHDEKFLHSLGVDSTTLPCLFIPNTYKVYWDTTPQELLQRMKKEHDSYWNAERTTLARKAGLTPDEAYTLASIVEQETANDAERPMIAGMYLNRLHSGMKLQADPTVKFALKNFALRRILHEHLTTDSPYNTYQHEGLPVGPICIPSLASIEAVLHYAHHDYMYMCAKEDFSGTHNFAVTYDEHLKNAKRYADALNARGIGL